jgi:hypothetical protein
MRNRWSGVPLDFSHKLDQIAGQWAIEDEVRWALIPPVFVLALGAVSVWVVRGFRQ